MEISLGFVFILTLLIFPGLIFRKLYFYGEFSKEFSSGRNLFEVLAVSAVPGLILFLLTFIAYDNWLTPIDISLIVNKFKDFNSPDVRVEDINKMNLNFVFFRRITPFLSLLYTISFILGVTLGRFVRITKLDTKFKILRFKNYWFYIFQGRPFEFKKLKHLKESNRKHVFTKADILISTSNSSELYSGIVVDYELLENDSCTLSKVYLQNATRYSDKKGAKTQTSIPGHLFIVDCSNLLNINLTYVTEDDKGFLASKTPGNIDLLFSIFIIALIPFLMFKSTLITNSIYISYFNLHWFVKILIYIAVVQVLGLTLPFIKKGDSYVWINLKIFVLRLLIAVILVWICIKVIC